MTRFKTALMMTTIAAFAAHPALALTLEQTNVSVGGGVFVPAIIVTDGPGAGTYKIGEQGLTQFIIYNEAALKAWASQMSGVEVSDVKVYEPAESPSDDNCKYLSSFDADLTADNLIYVADEDPIIDPSIELDTTDTEIPFYDLDAVKRKDKPCYNPCEWIGFVPSSVDQLILTQIIVCRDEPLPAKDL